MTVYNSTYVTNIELKVSITDHKGKALRGKLRSFRGLHLQQVIRNLLLFAKDHPDLFPQGIIQVNEMLDGDWRVHGLLDNAVDELVPPRKKFKMPKRPRLKGKPKLKR